MRTSIKNVKRLEKEFKELGVDMEKAIDRAKKVISNHFDITVPIISPYYNNSWSVSFIDRRDFCGCWICVYTTAEEIVDELHTSLLNKIAKARDTQ